MLARTSVHPVEDQERYRSTQAWPQTGLAEQVARWARVRPDRVAVIDGTDGRQVTYRQLQDDASRIAGWLRARGIRPGDGISVQLPNRYETVAVDVAILMLGARLNPLLPNYRRRELSHFLGVSRARAYFTPMAYRGFDHAELARELVDSLPDLDNHVQVDQEGIVGQGTHLDELLAAEPLRHPPAVVPSAVSELIFTSGTESQPKAVMHTEETVNHSATATVRHLGLEGHDVVWMPSPVGHSTGLNFGVRLALLHGLPVVLQDRWEPERAAALIETHRCSYTLAATTFLNDLLRVAHAQGRDLTSMTRFGCGGAPVPTELVREAATQGVQVLRIYGSTEGLIISWNQPNSPAEKKEMTDGLPPDDTQVAVWDDNGRILGPGEVGELMVHGPNVCVGFYKDRERTAATFTPEGWLRSGDLGRVDAEGYVTVVGRKKEVIIRGGLNIAPREIEELLLEMPGVRDVAVVGVPDERLGELVCACIVPEEGTEPALDDIVAFLRARDVALYKLPQQMRVIADLPRTPTGKVRKTELASALAAGSTEFDR